MLIVIASATTMKQKASSTCYIIGSSDVVSEDETETYGGLSEDCDYLSDDDEDDSYGVARQKIERYCFL